MRNISNALLTATMAYSKISDVDHLLAKGVGEPVQPRCVPYDPSVCVEFFAGNCQNLEQALFTGLASVLRDTYTNSAVPILEDHYDGFYPTAPLSAFSCSQNLDRDSCGNSLGCEYCHLPERAEAACSGYNRSLLTGRRGGFCTMTGSCPRIQRLAESGILPMQGHSFRDMMGCLSVDPKSTPTQECPGNCRLLPDAFQLNAAVGLLHYGVGDPLGEKGIVNLCVPFITPDFSFATEKSLLSNRGPRCSKFSNGLCDRFFGGRHCRGAEEAFYMGMGSILREAAENQVTELVHKNHHNFYNTAPLEVFSCVDHVTRNACEAPRAGASDDKEGGTRFLAECEWCEPERREEKECEDFNLALTGATGEGFCTIRGSCLRMVQMAETGILPPRPNSFEDAMKCFVDPQNLASTVCGLGRASPHYGLLSEPLSAAALPSEVPLGMLTAGAVNGAFDDRIDENRLECRSGNLPAVGDLRSGGITPDPTGSVILRDRTFGCSSGSLSLCTEFFGKPCKDNVEAFYAGVGSILRDIPAPEGIVKLIHRDDPRASVKSINVNDLGECGRRDAHDCMSGPLGSTCEFCQIASRRGSDCAAFNRSTADGFCTIAGSCKEIEQLASRGILPPEELSFKQILHCIGSDPAFCNEKTCELDRSGSIPSSYGLVPVPLKAVNLPARVPTCQNAALLNSSTIPEPTGSVLTASFFKCRKFSNVACRETFGDDCNTQNEGLYMGIGKILRDGAFDERETLIHNGMFYTSNSVASLDRCLQQTHNGGCLGATGCEFCIPPVYSRYDCNEFVSAFEGYMGLTGLCVPKGVCKSLIDMAENGLVPEPRASQPKIPLSYRDILICMASASECPSQNCEMQHVSPSYAVLEGSFVRPELPGLVDVCTLTGSLIPAPTSFILQKECPFCNL